MLAAVTCAHHPDRKGFALCTSCRKVVCQECATVAEGKNLCRPCLLAREQARKKEDAPLSPAVFLAVGAVLAVAAAFAMAWAGPMGSP